MYVVPSDAADRMPDTDGTIDASVGTTKPGSVGRPVGAACVSILSQSALDVTFRRLLQSDAQLSAAGLFIRDAIERELKAAGFDAPGRIYAVYYDGSSKAACGGGAWPPTLPGTVGAVYLRATYGGGLLCYDPSRSRLGLQLMDLALLHELLHTMGFVPTCAPHHTRARHVSDSPSDLMWVGEGNWNPTTLDIGRDDYFGAAIPGCPDLARSSYLDDGQPLVLTVTLEGAGHGTVRSTPPAIECPPTCLGTFARSSNVTLTATAATGSSFRGWRGACAGGGTCTLTMDAAKSVTATFDNQLVVLDVSIKGQGRVVSNPPGISCVRNCSARFPTGARVALRALPRTGASFRGWSGACHGRGCCSVAMNARRAVTASFRR